MEYIELKEQVCKMLSESGTLEENDNLIEKGLNSLMIMKLSSQWRRQGIKVPFAALMEEPTLNAWLKLINNSSYKSNMNRAKKQKEVKFNEKFPLTDVQYAYWVGREDNQILGGVGCHAYFEFDGENINPERLQKAWRRLLNYHPMLRARFTEDGKQEIMEEPYNRNIEICDYSNENPTRLEELLNKKRCELSHRKLQIEKGEVVGLCLCLLPNNKNRIHFDVDLLVADVQSLQVIFRDLEKAYKGEELVSGPEKWSFADYIKNQVSIDKKEIEEDKKYWQNRLENLPLAPDLPLAKHPEEIVNTKFKRRIYKLNINQWNILKEKAAEYKTTPAMMFLTAYAMILERWSTNKKFLINIPLFNRKTEVEGIDDVVADFTNLILLEVNCEEDYTFSSLLRNIEKQIHNDIQHSKYSGVQVQRDLAKLYEGQINVAPVVFACNLGKTLINKEFANDLGEFSYMISQTPQVWLDFQSYENESGLMLTWDTVDELFQDGMIDDMLDAFGKLLNKLMNSDWNNYFDVLPDKQRKFIDEQKKINKSVKCKCLFDEFLINMKKNPDKTAIVDTSKNICKTYKEVGEDALAIASYLVRNNIRKQPIAISLPRGYEQAVVILGVLISGNSYVPVSLNQPKERRQAIHDKTGIFYAITDEADYNLILWPDGISVWKVENLIKTEILKELPTVSPNDPAYIIMTSGTTGLPKGVEITHRGAWNTINDVNERNNITSKDSLLGVSAMDFDLSVYDFLGILSAGGTLVTIPEDKNRDADFWIKQILKFNITVWNSVPILLDMLLVQAESSKKVLPLRKVFLSGDWIGMDLPERLQKSTEKCSLIAMGGATEASIWSNFIEVKLPLPKTWKSIPYGRPLSNQSYRVIDKNGRDVPFWVKGELLIGGLGVGTYKGDKELVDKKFIKDESGIWYRTGDKGRFWSDGTIEFLGREDFQVKIRGHRIELGEIESALKDIEGVRKVVVDSSDGEVGDKHLIAFLESEETKKEPLFLKNLEVEKEIENRLMLLKYSKDISDSKNIFNEALECGEWLVCKAMLETLQEINIFKDDKEYSFEDIISKGNIDVSYEKTIRCWLDYLVKSEFIKYGDTGYKLSEIKDEEIKNISVKGVALYIQRLNPYLPQILQGKVNPIDIYYDKNNKLSPNDLLNELPGTQEVINVLISKVKDLVRASKRKIRILEIGTRDIEITRMILDSLQDFDVEYVYSDSSAFFINKVKSITEKNTFVEFKVIDFEKDINNYDIESKFDCIIAINTIHRMCKKQTVFSNLKYLLAPAGVLMMTELTEKTSMQGITADVLDDYSKTDNDRGILDFIIWHEILEQNGFDKNIQIPAEGKINGRNIFMSMESSKKYSLDTQYINFKIKDKLPDYMVPKVYHLVDKLPLSKNGKVDRKALKKLVANDIDENKIVQPRTKTEVILCDIWRKAFQLKEIGIENNYYYLGGDSLIATKMLANIKAEFKVEFTMRDLMDKNTIKEQAELIDQLIKDKKQVETVKLPQIVFDKEHENEPFSLTDVQQAYWIGRSGMYNLGQVSTHCYFEMDGDFLDVNRLQKAWNELISYHGMMRCIILKDGKQQILKSVPEYQIEVTHLEKLSKEQVEQALQVIRDNMSHQVIDTEKWPLFDIKVTAMPEEKYRVHVSFDNLIFDGWSMFHLLNEWAEKYRGEFKEKQKLQVSFRDYVLGLEKIKNSSIYEKDKKYWESRIEGFCKAPEFPLVKDEAQVVNQRFNRREAYLTSNEWNSLKDLAKNYGITPAVLLITAYSETIRRWSTNNDFTLNLTQFNRKELHPQVNELVGDFTTLTLLEIKNSKEKSFLERAKNVQKQLIKDLEHTLYSTVDLERELKKQTGNMKSSIMPVVFTSGLGINQWNKDKWIGKLVYNVSQTPQVWLDHQVVECDGCLGLFWDSVDELFYPGMLDEMFNAYINLLKSLAKETELFIKEIPSLINIKLSEERINANKTDKKFFKKTLDEMFIEAADKNPNKEAIVTSNRRMIYKEVKDEALYVSEYLRSQKVESNELVAIVMDKGWQQIVAAYGILFTGAAYLPIDINNPKERIEKILTDSNVKVILTQQEIMKKHDWISNWNYFVVNGCISDNEIQPIKNNSSDMAYVIYTSGSTGMPKGVMITHEGAVNTIQDVNQRYEVNKNDKAIAISNLHFDLSVYDIFGVLGVGGTLVIPDYLRVKDPGYWIELINNEEITIWNSVPAFMEMLAEYEEHHKKLIKNSLRLIIMSGDWIPRTLSKTLYKIFGNIKIVAMGGATEASIWSNAFDIPKEIPMDWNSIPYGKPLSNQRYYILNEQLLDCPDWVPGMLYIAGTGLAKGYLNDEIKTNEKFIRCKETGEYLYCTGDMGRYWPDGNIEFLGRTDNQVKINGYRVELGELESALLEDEVISKVCSVVINNSIVSVVVLKEGQLEETLIDGIKNRVKEKVPKYLVPSQIIVWDELPLSSNYKVDRKKVLSDIKELQLSIDFKDECLRDDLEKKLADIWKEILEINNVLNSDNFFEKGGDSLKAIKLANLVQDEFNVEISLQVLFDKPQFAEMADVIREEKENGYEEGVL